MADESNAGSDVKPGTIIINVKNQVTFLLASLSPLTFHKQNGETTQFRLKRHASMKKLMDAYLKRAGVEPSAMRFLVDGQTIKKTDTPEAVALFSKIVFCDVHIFSFSLLPQLELEDGDQIDAVMEQVGGGEGEHNSLL